MNYIPIYIAYGVASFLYGTQIESVKQFIITIPKIVIINYITVGFFNDYIHEYYGSAPGSKLYEVNYDLKRGLKGMLKPLTMMF